MPHFEILEESSAQSISNRAGYFLRRSASWVLVLPPMEALNSVRPASDRERVRLQTSNISKRSICATRCVCSELVLIRIDGSFGEGGGQIMRTLLSLSLVTITWRPRIISWNARFCFWWSAWDPSSKCNFNATASIQQVVGDSSRRLSRFATCRSSTSASGGRSQGACGGREFAQAHRPA